MSKFWRMSVVSGGLGLFAVAAVASAQVASTTPTGVPPPSTVSSPAAVGSTLEMHINNDGSVLVRGAKITSINGTTVHATQTWGSYSVNWVVQTSPSTQLLRRYGGASSLSEFVVGDYISFSGTIDPSQSQGTVIAKVVKDFSVQKVNATFSGSVSSVSTSSTSFMLQSKSRGMVNVVLSPSTTIKKGSATTTFLDIAVGATISRASGVWDNLTNTLQATVVEIYVDQHLLDRRTFEGTLSSLAGSTTPTTFTYVVGATTYTVNVAASTALLSNGWNPTQVALMHVGDKIRVYGAVEANNMSTIDAYVVRDTSIK